MQISMASRAAWPRRPFDWAWARQSTGGVLALGVLGLGVLGLGVLGLGVLGLGVFGLGAPPAAGGGSDGAVAGGGAVWAEAAAAKPMRAAAMTRRLMCILLRSDTPGALARDFVTPPTMPSLLGGYVYLMACGLIGEPVPPVMISGGPQKKNS
jgi:hypothetical protein